MDTQLFMECEEEELEPWQQVDDSVEEEDVDFMDNCEPEEDSLSPLPASETPPIDTPSPLTPVHYSSLFCSDHLHQSQSSSHLPHNLHLQPDHPHHACCHGTTSTCPGPPPHPDSDRGWNLPPPSSHWKRLHPAHSTGLSSDEPRCPSVAEPAAGPGGPPAHSDPVLFVGSVSEAEHGRVPCAHPGPGGSAQTGPHPSAPPGPAGRCPATAVCHARLAHECPRIRQRTGDPGGWTRLADVRLPRLFPWFSQWRWQKGCAQQYESWIQIVS
ncbi:hypothetical protein fugu_009516 [Takifugu bimaculatus]|uniref:Uncharacterized protein n=1 Tax=Takifugu bimaculatus TaxID=433685 RepID=A0A4Z2CCV7_9TELE|nr:hypothetical protein fugu_009516 [Takifugu bimaculatus]